MLWMGEYPHTSLERARKRALEARALLAQNMDTSGRQAPDVGHRSITSTTMYTDLAEQATDSVWAA